MDGIKHKKGVYTHHIICAINTARGFEMNFLISHKKSHVGPEGSPTWQIGYCKGNTIF